MCVLLTDSSGKGIRVFGEDEGVVAYLDSIYDQCCRFQQQSTMKEPLAATVARIIVSNGPLRDRAEQGSDDFIRLLPNSKFPSEFHTDIIEGFAIFDAFYKSEMTDFSLFLMRMQFMSLTQA